MEKSQSRSLSVFISLILRHNPGAVNITLDEHGWADVNELLAGINAAGRSIDMETLEEIVRTDQKNRYSFNPDRTLIRANQGHSVAVDVELTETQPPCLLYHGTADRFLPGIMKDGLKPMSRLYVHLSKDTETAVKVGSRHGKPAVLTVKSGEMQADGYRFYLSANGVWLTNRVPAEYIMRES